ncbi:two-component system, OmpR family, sensor histidine kinase SenX3 [Kytococcus aerolatus]|uniref:Sensor-like histidine kinase SenX3 n=1 Tax=Kytococcus aerolatus TaxID=592308 RepID=A0A212U6B5_9MICO|nr:ATP-binding protein [Kytococcus aerolatus]SNC73631.1 two-component system, OmpR family, sensor histidine kinase SenX3 [Kytococcus aerolatus]
MPELVTFLLAAVMVLVAGFLGVRSGMRRRPVRQQARAVVGPLSPGVRQLLEGLAATAIVVRGAGAVVYSTQDARQQGFVRDGLIRQAEIREVVETAHRTGEVADEEVTVTRSMLEGGRVALGVRVLPLDPDHFVVLLDDRSRAQRVEEVRRDFVANVSHELKTPVGGLGLLAEAVHDAHDDPEAVRHFASRMQVEAERLSSLVQEIVEFSRVQAGEWASQPVPVNVLEVVGTAIDQVRVMADDKGVAVRLAGLAHGLPSTVYGDPDMLMTALRNLLVNAVTYSDPGTKVVVSAREDEADGLVRVLVTDQGMGIPPADLERIFERFYRVDGARSRNTGGSGLGLAIVRHVVATHGGVVTVWSRPGVGSTFTVALPVIDETETAGGDEGDLEEDPAADPPASPVGP